MYKHLTREDIRKALGVKESYRVDGVIVVGTHPKVKEYTHLYEALKKLPLPYAEEKIDNTFFGDIKSLMINNRRIWFDVVYGTAYMSEILHVASILGSQGNILLGTCGGLQKNMKQGDTILPVASYGNESSTRMYQPDNKSFLYNSNEKLRNAIKERLTKRTVVYEGKLITVQAMLAESKEDIESWSAQGYLGVDMESSTLFAVSEHFNVPSSALLYVADNLVTNELVTDSSFELLRTQRIAVRKENYEIALRVLVGGR